MASNLRVLVSNLGDGNWTPIYNTATPPVLQTTSPNLVTEVANNHVKYFPPGGVDGTGLPIPPTVEQQIGSSVNTIGWGSKTNWMFQLSNEADSAGTHEIDVAIYGYRPTGVIELIKSVPKASIQAGETFSFGGVGGEEVYGPFVAFKFEADRTSATGNPLVLCYVIGWNYGDIWDNQIELT